MVKHTYLFMHPSNPFSDKKLHACRPSPLLSSRTLFSLTPFSSPFLLVSHPPFPFSRHAPTYTTYTTPTTPYMHAYARNPCRDLSICMYGEHHERQQHPRKKKKKNLKLNTASHAVFSGPVIGSSLLPVSGRGKPSHGCRHREKKNWEGGKGGCEGKKGGRMCGWGEIAQC